MPTPRWHRILLFALLSFLILSIFFPYSPVRRLDISYTQFKKLVEEEKVSEITFQREQIKGKFDNPLTEELEAPKEDEGLRVYEAFETIQPPVEDRVLLALLDDKGVAVHAEPEQENWWRLILYSARRFQGGMGGGGGLFGFGKSKAKLYTKGVRKNNLTA